MTRTSTIGIIVAAVWSIVLWIGGTSVPVYSSETVSSDGSSTQASQTLVGANGTSAIVVLLLPLMVTVLVALSLALVRGRPGLVLAWVLTGLLAAFTLLAMLSVGIFLIPVTAGLVVACVGARARSRAVPSTVTG
jgi:hypothetical protein